MKHREEKHDEECEVKCCDDKPDDEKDVGEHHGKKDDDKEKEHVKEDDKSHGGEHGDGKFAGIHFSKKDLYMAAGGAAGVLALLGLGRFAGRMRPLAVGAVREGYAFKEWVAGKVETVKEDVEDIVAEGVHRYREDVETAADTVRREKDILEKVGKLVEDRLARLNVEKGGE